MISIIFLVLFLLICNWFVASLAIFSLKTGRPAIVGLIWERSKGAAITKQDHPLVYWFFTVSYIIFAASFIVQSVLLISSLFMRSHL